MSNNINLLPSKKKNIVHDDILLKVCKRVSIVFLLVTAISSIALFLLNLNPGLSQILQQKNNTITNLAFTQGKVAKYLLIKDRVKAIDSILHTRRSLDNTLGAIQGQLPNDVVVDSFTLDNNTLVLTASSVSLSSLDSFLNNIATLMYSKKVLKSLTIDGVSAQQDTGRYVASIKSDVL